jgi:cephalosporin-C deacetylase-like acetyl esterase
MSFQKVVKVTFLVFRSPDYSEEDFYEYWSKVHATTLLPVMQRHNVIEYKQVSPSIPSLSLMFTGSPN